MGIADPPSETRTHSRPVARVIDFAINRARVDNDRGPRWRIIVVATLSSGQLLYRVALAPASGFGLPARVGLSGRKLDSTSPPSVRIVAHPSCARDLHLEYFSSVPKWQPSTTISAGSNQGPPAHSRILRIRSFSERFLGS